ncbi:MAG: RNA polymerase sigma factor [Brevundimonas sp.]
MPLASSIDDIAASLSRFVGRRLRDRSLREDMVQETITRLLAYSRRHEIKDAAALSRRIALNLITDHFRDRQRHPTDVLSDDLPAPAAAAEEIVMHRERVRAFGRVLETMPPLRREVFMRLRLHGETAAEISVALSLSEVAVEKHLTRALEQLHREVERAERPRIITNPSHDLDGDAR